MQAMTFNSWAGAILSALLIIVGGRVLVHETMHVEAPEKPGFEIAVTEAAATGGSASEPTPVEPPIASLLPAATADAGLKLAKPCLACHDFTKGGPNKVGPNMWDVVNRDIGKHAGFTYSTAMGGKGGQWTYDELNKFLTNPKVAIAGTKMAYAGIKKPEDRANLIAYLRSLADSPAPLP